MHCGGRCGAVDVWSNHGAPGMAASEAGRPVRLSHGPSRNLKHPLTIPLKAQDGTHRAREGQCALSFHVCVLGYRNGESLLSGTTFCFLGYDAKQAMLEIFNPFVAWNHFWEDTSKFQWSNLYSQQLSNTETSNVVRASASVICSCVRKNKAGWVTENIWHHRK